MNSASGINDSLQVVESAVDQNKDVMPYSRLM